MNRRQTERVPLSKYGTMDTRRHSHSIRTVDISQTGACVSCNTSTVTIGENVTLIVGNLRSRGSIMWTSMDRVGISFDTEVHTSVLDQLLT